MSLTARFPCESAPVPVSATLVTTNVYAVTFNKPLVNQPLSAANWTADLGAYLPVSAAYFAPNQVRLTFSPSDDPSTIDYLATTPDVEGTNGLDVQAFADFPIT